MLRDESRARADRGGAAGRGTPRAAPRTHHHREGGRGAGGGPARKAARAAGALKGPSVATADGPRLERRRRPPRHSLDARAAERERDGLWLSAQHRHESSPEPSTLILVWLAGPSALSSAPQRGFTSRTSSPVNYVGGRRDGMLWAFVHRPMSLSSAGRLLFGREPTSSCPFPKWDAD
ncbi:hypothetical protein EVAR_67472_1 [Eumeta japonica]|uniref:Uncharacterized protein n=1 Tax=Eumeta variegata TaxID=151549 RepID=A0A4C1Z794_EUMVA|nr:hypothetical protein EVAR_67472_1 [Eumeta japonica]